MLHKPLRLRLLPLGNGVRIDVFEHIRPKRVKAFGNLCRHHDLLAVLAVDDDVMHEGVQTFLQRVPEKRRQLRRNVALADNLPTDCIVNVMVYIREPVGEPDDITLEGEGMAARLMLADTVNHFPRKIQTGAVLLQNGNHANALLIVGKAKRTDTVERPLPRMPERRVSEVMPKGNGLRKILVQKKCLGDRSRNLRNLQRVCHAGAVMVPLRCQKHLRLILQSTEGFGVDDAVPVPLKNGPDITLLLLAKTPQRLVGVRRARPQHPMFPLFQHGANIRLHGNTPPLYALLVIIPQSHASCKAFASPFPLESTGIVE